MSGDTQVKAYTTRVGHGPFPTELQNEMQSLEAHQVEQSLQVECFRVRTSPRLTLDPRQDMSEKVTQAGLD